jgi:hypothetical protein
MCVRVSVGVCDGVDVKEGGGEFVATIVDVICAMLVGVGLHATVSKATSMNQTNADAFAQWFCLNMRETSKQV